MASSSASRVLAPARLNICKPQESCLLDSWGLQVLMGRWREPLRLALNVSTRKKASLPEPALAFLLHLTVLFLTIPAVIIGTYETNILSSLCAIIDASRIARCFCHF